MKRSFITYSCLTLVATLSLMGCPPDVAELGVSMNNLHFGVDVETEVYETVKQFDVLNKGGSDTTLVFAIVVDQPWISVSPENGTIAGNDSMTISVTIDRSYTETKGLDFATGELTINASNMQKKVGVTTAPNYYTQEFDGDFDLGGKQLWLTPSSGLSYYYLQTAESNVFPTDPTGGLLLNFDSFGDPIAASPLGNQEVPFYGVHYDTLYISSGGWISFGAPGNNPDSLGDHFAVPQISILPVDGTYPGSMVSFLQDAEKLIITYENVPSAADPSVTNHFQVEMFFDGTIRITYPNVDPLISGVIGLSAGVGENGEPPVDFLESTLNTNPISVVIE